MKQIGGGRKRPVFQNHAVSMCEREDGKFIATDEAHFICAILNAPITQSFITNSSDSRSFKIRPPVFIPVYSGNNKLHKRLSDLSKKAHKNYADQKIIAEIDEDINEVYLEICRSENK